jgi:hypothetical protein
MVVIVFGIRLCITMWLPRRRTSMNPSASRILHEEGREGPDDDERVRLRQALLITTTAWRRG